MRVDAKTWLVRPVVFLFVVLCLTGCLTADTLDAAKAHTHTNEKGEVVIDEPAKPGYYAQLPLAILADTILLPVYAVAIVGVNLGLMTP
jgi:uncharacterized protein YceK